MTEVIQYWLGTRVGVMLDMSPEKFGRNTKDGKLLAKLLYSYGVIPAQILNNVKESKNYYECYNNLLILKPWLRYIGVIHDDGDLQKMAGGEGSTSISVFYAVYLNLERKDRWHYLSAQKERRISQDGCQKFKVNWVPERFVSSQPENQSSKLFNLISEKSELINWHKEKCNRVVEQIKKTKERFRKMNEKKRELGPILSKEPSSQPLDKKQAEAEETKKQISAFEAKHERENPDLNFSELVELQNMSEMQPCFEPNPAEAKNIVSGIKRRKRGEVYARNFQQKMQNMLLDEQWKEVVEKQEKDFENVVCQKLLKQSQYEKQMMKRLYLLRNQKKMIAENRRKIECLKIDERQKEYEEFRMTDEEPREEDWGEAFEKERIAELHRRTYDQKARSRRAAIRIECQKICDAMVDIAVRISEAREIIGCQVPKAFMRDLLELFFKDLPIFDVLDHFEEIYDEEAQPDLSDVNEWGEEDHGGVIFFQNSEYERLKKEELDRQTVLDECDLNDYLQLMGPWMVDLLFPSGMETEEKNVVLGYIVHKILAVKYPSPNAPVAVEVKSMKYKSVVQGLKEDTARNMLTDLLATRKILVVRVEDAINFVLSAYKEELSDVSDINFNFQRATDDALKQSTFGGKEKEGVKKILLLKGKGSEKMPVEEEPVEGVLDKETQTPKVFPGNNTTLSPNADLGKQTFEALGVGDPVPDSVVIPSIVAYVVAKQNDHEGWVLLDYPCTYLQARDLEYLLSGYRNLPSIDHVEACEESEGYNYRINFGDQNSKDLFSESRFSRLVPNPYVASKSDAKISRTYFDCFIKLRKVSDSSRHRSESFDDFGLMEKYYFDSEILFDFEYQNLNFQVIKNLGRAILGAVDQHAETQGVVKKTSVEIFGSAVLDLNEKWDFRKKSMKDVGGLRKVSNEFRTSVPTSLAATEVNTRGPKSGDEGDEETEEKLDESLWPAKPGDPLWEWATGPQPKNFLTAQAGFWESLEAIYVEDFKNVFFCLRVHRYNLINYCGFLKKTLRIVMRKPDDRQKVLSEFQQMFNDIDEDLRPDEDVKCELHVRVSELEQALMGLADERKKNSLKDTTRMAQDNWVPDEMASLVNTFLSAIQLETDRCIGSCQVIMDYYSSLQQKMPDEKPIPKSLVPKLQVQNRKYSVSSNFSSKSASTNSPRYHEGKRPSKSQSDQYKVNLDKSSKMKSLGEKKKKNSENNLDGAADFITDILTNLRLPDDGLTPFHNFFMDTVHSVTNEVKNTVENCILEVRKVDKARMSATRQGKALKKPSEIYFTLGVNENLIAEWTTALEVELARFLFRTQLILARGIFDMNEFLTTILNILFSLTEEIMEMYLKEIKSISECCKVFRCCIEEEVQIRPRLELKDEQFIVHMDESATPQSGETVKPAVDSDQERFHFTVDQLCLLFNRLQRVAPNGEIIKRSLLYIFEDLRVMKPEVETFSCFPEIWSDMEPDDTTTVLNEIYQNLEVVPWKDFIIYALELPVPNQTQILTMRRLFRKYDPQVTELISRENYETITFWFENTYSEKEIEKSAKAKALLFRMYQVNAFQTNYSALMLAFCKDQNPVLGFEKALALTLGKKIRKYEEGTESVMGEGRACDYETVARSSKARSTCSSIANTEPPPKCIPKERIVRCNCKDETEETVTEESSAENEWEYKGNEMEGEEHFYFAPDNLRRSSEASVVPLNILSSLLKAAFPSMNQLSILLDCEHTFQETLTSIYDSLEPDDNNVDIDRLINHKFINRLLFCTNKFKFVKLKPILLSVANVNSPKPRVVCFQDKPKLYDSLRK